MSFLKTAIFRSFLQFFIQIIFCFLKKPYNFKVSFVMYFFKIITWMLSINLFSYLELFQSLKFQIIKLLLSVMILNLMRVFCFKVILIGYFINKYVIFFTFLVWFVINWQFCNVNVCKNKFYLGISKSKCKNVKSLYMFNIINLLRILTLLRFFPKSYSSTEGVVSHKWQNCLVLGLRAESLAR